MKKTFGGPYVEQRIPSGIVPKGPKYSQSPSASHTSLAYSSLRPVTLLNFLGSCVAGVGKPETTELEQLLLGRKAVAITSRADSNSK